MNFHEVINFNQFDGKSAEENTSRLAQVYKAQTKFLSMKWEQYFEIYERHLRPYILENKPLNLLEIGVQNGGSLETWKAYLPAGSKIWGIDIDPLCKELQFSEGITFIHGSGTDKELIEKHLSNIEFDVIIDDGSHQCADVNASFGLLFPQVKPGGLYIVEDAHSSYWTPFGGQYKKEGSIIEFFKKYIDSIHYKYIANKSILSPEENAFHKIMNKYIAAVMFYDSVVIVEKYLRDHPKGFRNYMTQGESHVVSRHDSSTAALNCTPQTSFEKIYK